VARCYDAAVLIGDTKIHTLGALCANRDLVGPARSFLAVSRPNQPGCRTPNFFDTLRIFGWPQKFTLSTLLNGSLERFFMKTARKGICRAVVA